MLIINLIKFADKFLARAAAAAIGFYQISLSPDHGLLRARYPYGFCRYYPSCSQYAKQSLLRKGFFAGTVISAWRILRCNPWAKPNLDEP